MQRSSIYMLAVLLLGATAFAQKDARSRLRPKGPVHYAGIYNYGLGTWTRPGSESTELGPVFSTIYSNTTSSPYFGAIYGGEYWTDEGRLPSPTSPDKIFSDSQASTGAGFVGTVNQCPEGPSSAPGSARGSASSYTISGFQIGYCSQAVGFTTQINAFFFNSAGPLSGGRCPQPLGAAAAPVAGFSLLSFPGAVGPTNPIVCWVVSVNLNAASATFTMAADATGSYTTPARSSELEHVFAWTFSFPTDPGLTGPSSSIASGFFIEGAPSNQHVGPNMPVSGTPNTNGWAVLAPPLSFGIATGGYDGTVWDVHGANAAPSLFNGGDNGSRGTFTVVATPSFAGGIEDGTGMSSQDCFRVDNPNGNPLALPGDFFYGGPTVGATNPFASFHLELYSLDNTVILPAGLSPGTGFCYGDGCAFTCPCTVGTIPDPQGHHESGCANSATATGFGANIGSILTAATGTSANPFPGNVRLDCQVDHLPPLQIPFCLGSKGNARLENGSFPPLNDGTRCVDGAIIRFGGHNAGANGSPAGGWHYPTTAAGETIPLSLRTGATNGQTSWYQVIHRNAPNNFCFSDPTIGTNWSNGVIIKWGAP